MATKPQALTEDEKNRRKKLRLLIDNHFNGNASSFAARAGLTRASISQLLSDGQPFGELRARGIEEKVGLPIGYFD